MADVWAVGCVIIELLTRERLRDAIWHDGVEVSGRRQQLIGRVEREEEGRGSIIRELLHLDKNSRLSALRLKLLLVARAAAAEAEEAPRVIVLIVLTKCPNFSIPKIHRLNTLNYLKCIFITPD